MSAEIARCLIEFQGVSKSFEGRTILQSLNLCLREGQCHLLLGENGAGKSTLLRIMAGLLAPDQGMITQQATSRRWRKARDFLRGHVMYLHQTPYLFDGSVRQNLQYALPATLRGKAREQRLQQVLDWSELSNLALSPAKQLSGGEKQRVALARAFLRQAPVLLLDEPTANLDRTSRQRTIALLHSLKQRGVCLLIACHDAHGLDILADGNYQLSAGSLLAEQA